MVSSVMTSVEEPSETTLKECEGLGLTSVKMVAKGDWLKTFFLILWKNIYVFMIMALMICLFPYLTLN